MSQQKHKTKPSRQFLEALYSKYNHRCFVNPDPLQFLYAYKSQGDREIVALLASSLAYGKVNQIITSTSIVLEKLSPSPKKFLEDKSDKYLKNIFPDFKHRFTTGKDLSNLLLAISDIIKQYGSLQTCFNSGLGKEDTSIIPALTCFTKNIRKSADNIEGNLLPCPEKGSACKRLNLFLRWMVRKDRVDPGGWKNICPSLLVIPLDTHMFKIGRSFGFTERKQPGMKAAIEITEGFRQFSPRDPTRYDFALTRFGIRNDLEISTVINHHDPDLNLEIKDY